jgi:hypothetical protein
MPVSVAPTIWSRWSADQLAAGEEVFRETERREFLGTLTPGRLGAID